MSAPDRMQPARFALASACWARGDTITSTEEALIDLLTDLRHLCAAEQVSFGACDRMARVHFEAEHGTDDDGGAR